MSVTNALQLVPQALRDDILGGVCQEWPSVEVVPNAVVALIDISQYTKITSMLTQMDSTVAGARVREIVNPPFVIIIETVHKWGEYCSRFARLSDKPAGGSVIKFAGDAALVCWGDKSSDILGEALKATACGVELLAAMKGYQVDISPIKSSGFASTAELTTIPLKIHVGVGLGAMYRVRLGDPTLESTAASEHTLIPRREFFVAGPAVVNAGEMEGLAGSGEMAVAATIRPLLADVMGQGLKLRSAPDGSILISETDNLDAIMGLLQPAYALYDPGRAELFWRSEGVIVERPAFMSRDYLRVLSYVDESLAIYLSKSEAAYGRVAEE
ncbi:hypothetical protein HK101_007123, partial [Irineochytrium annulatum]